MITKTDLSQIRTVLREEIEAEHDEIQSEIKLVRIQIESRLRQIEDRLKDLTIKGNKKYVVDFFDKEYLTLKKRVEKLESTVSLHSA